MISHEHVGMDRALEFAGKFTQVIKIKLVILVRLDKVHWNLGESDAGAAGHGYLGWNEGWGMLANKRGLSPICSICYLVRLLPRWITW